MNSIFQIAISVQFALAAIISETPQLSSYDDLVSFRVKCYNKDLSKREDVNIIFEIFNQSSKSLTIPSKLSTVPAYSREGAIGYEIFKLNENNTLINITDSIVFNISTNIPEASKDELKAGASFLFEGRVSSIFFERPGVYRIRFTLRKSFSRDIIKADMLSEWITVIVRKS